MEIKVASTCLNWSERVYHNSPSSFWIAASVISSPSPTPLNRRSRNDGMLFCRFVHRSDLFSTSSTKLLRSPSYDGVKNGTRILKRTCCAGLDEYSDEEFKKESQYFQELALRFHLSNEDNSEIRSNAELDRTDFGENEDESNCINSVRISRLHYVEPPFLRIQPEPPDWPERDEFDRESIERKANSMDLPLSLRIIKRKKQWQEGFTEAGESAYCSVKAAFSSMLFIIRELYRYTLQMREILFYEDLQEILVRVQKEVQASFVWLFQQVFSHTPTLMVYVMILLANFTVYSMGNNTAIAAPPSPPPLTETMSVNENQNQQPPKFDSLAIRSFSVSSSIGKTISVGPNRGGGGGGGRNVRPVVSGTEGGDGRFDGSSSSNYHRTIFPGEKCLASSFGNRRTKEALSASELESESQGIMCEEEMNLWNLIVEEASSMQTALRDKALDQETTQRFVSPVQAVMEPEDYSTYFRTELLYQIAVSQEPDNPLILANYAQFLYFVVHDHNRAEEYFKRAITVEPVDAESLSRYANFLWLVRKDLSAAEETYLEAIAAEPWNSVHAANYAHFLFNTGGEDTCYPLNPPDNDYDDG